MSENETPKFTVIDRRKYRPEDEQKTEAASRQDDATETPKTAKPVETAAPEAPSAGPQLVVDNSKPASSSPVEAPAVAAEPEMPAPPTAEENRQQKVAYDAAAQRLEDLIRAQNPGMGAQPPITFEHLVQQFYVSAMIQMGAGTQEGQQPRVDILGARQTIDLMGILAEKTKGNLTEVEDRTMQTVLFEVRVAFLELTSMISLQGIQPPPPVIH
jgi:hypothetical protein